MRWTIFPIVALVCVAVWLEPVVHGTDKDPKNPKTPLPFGWDKLSLNQSQKTEMLEIHKRHEPKMKELERSINEERQQEYNAMLKVLNEEQKKALAKIAPVVLASAYGVKIVEIEETTASPSDNIRNARLIFDRKIPNGQATLIVDLGKGRKEVLRLWQENKKGLALGDPIDRMETQWSKDRKISFDDLKGQDALLYSNQFPSDTWHWR